MADTNQKICIVGAGPAGLSAAMYLEKKGYTNYSILDKADQVGGKCHSPEYKGKRYEMGAIMGVPEYTTVLEIMDWCGIKADGPKLDREFRRANGKKYNPYPITEGLKIKGQIKKFGKILEGQYKGYDKNNHLNTNPDLMIPFHDFCMQRGLDKVEDIWLNPFTAFGYGFFDEIAAAYVLQYLDLPTTISFVKKDLLTWKDGTQSIYERLNDKLKNHARLNVNITKITRENGQVQVYIDGQAEPEVYDKIIVTAPLDQMLTYLADATDTEKTYFSKITHERYMVFACLVDNYPKISGYIPENQVPERLGRTMVYYHRWANEPEQVITCYALGNHKDDPQVSMDQARENVKEDMKTFGIPVKEIIYERDWYYFPHVSCDEYKNGWYDTVEGMQGAKNMYYAGEVMSFGDMDETTHYSKDLVERFF